MIFRSLSALNKWQNLNHVFINIHFQTSKSNHKNNKTFFSSGQPSYGSLVHITNKTDKDMEKV